MELSGKIKSFSKKNNKTLYCSNCGSDNLKHKDKVMYCKDCNTEDDRVDIILSCSSCNSESLLNTKYYNANNKRDYICSDCIPKDFNSSDIDNGEELSVLYKASEDFDHKTYYHYIDDPNNNFKQDIKEIKKCKICEKEYTTKNKFDKGICSSCIKEKFEHRPKKFTFQDFELREVSIVRKYDPCFSDYVASGDCHAHSEAIDFDFFVDFSKNSKAKSIAMLNLVPSEYCRFLINTLRKNSEPEYKAFCCQCGHIFTSSTPGKYGRNRLCSKCDELLQDIDTEKIHEIHDECCGICGKVYKTNNNYHLVHSYYNIAYPICHSCKVEFLTKNPEYTGIKSCKNCGKEFCSNGSNICEDCDEKLNYEIISCKICGESTYRKIGSKRYTCEKCQEQKEKEIEMKNAIKKEIQKCKTCGEEYIIYKAYDKGFCSCCELEKIKRNYNFSKDFNLIDMQEVQKCRTCGIEFNPKNSKDIVCGNCQNS